MKLIQVKSRSILTIGILATMTALPGFADGVNDFALTKAIPADVFMTVHSRNHEGMEFLNRQFARVWEEVQAVRFDRDLKRFFKSIQQEGLPPGTEPEGFEEWWQQVYDLATAVDWAALGEREFAFAMKQTFPIAECVMLFMPPKDKVKESFDGLSGVAKTIVGFGPDILQLNTQELDGDVIHTLTIIPAPFPFVFTIANHKDVILVALGPTIAEQSLSLLRGEPGESFASSARFQEAFKKLPPPADSLTFVDMAKFFKQFRAYIDQLTQMAAAEAVQFEPASGQEQGESDVAEGAAEPQEQEEVQGSVPDQASQMKVWMALPGKILDELDVIEYIAEVSVTKGKLTTADTITVLRSDAKNRALYQILTNNKPLADPLKYIPESASEFSVMSGVDLKAFWKTLVRIIRNDTPVGPDFDAALEDLKAETGWDVEADLIGWIGGGMQSFSIQGPNPYSPGEFAFMLSVSDEAKGREIIERLMALLTPILAGQNGSIVDAELEGVEGFKTIVFPMLAMVGLSKPTIGIHDGWLFFGSSPDVIKTTLRVAAGEVPNVSKNERFLKEGIAPKGNVTALSFKDLTKLGEQIGGVLQMLPMISMGMPDIMKDPKMQTLMSIVSKVGRVVRKLDFFQSSSSRTTFEDNVFTTKVITTYREPPAPPAKPAPPTEETKPSGEPTEGSE